MACGYSGDFSLVGQSLPFGPFSKTYETAASNSTLVITPLDMTTAANYIDIEWTFTFTMTPIDINQQVKTQDFVVKLLS